MSIRIETLSVFPEMFGSIMSASMMGIAQRKGILEFEAHDLRDWTHDRHRTTDDEPYGGGPGQLMKCEPVFEALDDLCEAERCRGAEPTVIFFSPCGEPFTQATALELSQKEHLIMVCGHYEGFDERVYTCADMTLSLGDFVITGGELAALVVTDAVVRLVNGVLGDEESPVDESFYEGLLEYPQYTRPASYRGLDVPAVLLSGDHAKVDAWRREQSVIRTAELRPDLIESAALTPSERDLARSIMERNTGSDEQDAEQGVMVNE